jgi:hypothetical protein
MQSKNPKKSIGLILLAVSIVLVASAVALIAVIDNQNSYWTLNIEAPSGWNVTPNGTIQVPANQYDVNVTVNKAPFGAYGSWRLDGSSYGSFEQTITIPKQAAGSNHTLNINWVQPTPALQPIANEDTHINPGCYQAYNFTAIENMKNSIVANVNASSIIRVYVMDGANFMLWKNGAAADYCLSTGANCTIDYLNLQSSGVYYFVLDNTNSQNVCAVSATVTLQYTPIVVIVQG